MPVELKDILTYLDIKAEEGKELSFEDVKTHVQTKFVPVDHLQQRQDLLDPFIKAAVGQIAGSTQTAIISNAKDLGVEVTHKDFEGRKLTEVIPEIFGKVKSALDEYKGKKPDEQLIAKLAQRETEYKTLADQFNGVKSEYDGYKQQVQFEKVSATKNLVKQQSFGAISFKTNASELEKTGFKALIENDYDLEVDENGNSFAIHKNGDKKGSRVQNPASATSFLKFDELVKMKAAELKLIADPREGQPARSTYQQPTQQAAQPANGQATRKFNPRAGIGR